jgi:hypothetical protein
MKFKGTLIVLCLFTLTINSSAMSQETPDLLAIADAADKVLNSHDSDGWLSYFTDDAVLDLTIMPPPLDSPDKIKAMLEDQFAGSPDWHTTDGRIFSVDNIVVVEHAGAGTNTGENSLGPATGNPWIWPHLDIYEFEGDKIKRLTTHSDFSASLIQRGLLPAPEMPDLIPSFALPDPEPTGLTPLAAAVESYARWNSKDLAHYAKLFHPDAEFFLSPLGTPLDKGANTAMDELYLQAFSDRQAEVLRFIGLGDGWILSEVIFSGTHTGEYGGVPATGSLFNLRGAVLQRFDADGLLTNHNVYYDNLTLMTQITTPEFLLDGIWITAAPTPMGNSIFTTIYVAQDAAKTRFGGTLKAINSFPLLQELYPDSDPFGGREGGGQAVKVGRNRYEATFVGYITKVDPDLGMREIVGLNTLKAHFEIVGPDLIQGHGTGSYYMAAQDADQDGFPDEGQEPAACFPWTWTARRPTQLPGCEPAPNE